MPISVTLAAVKCIIELDSTVDDTCWQAMLDDAQTFVEGLDESIETECSEAAANAVTKYLAAHFMTIRDPRQIEEETLDARDRFANNTGMGFDSSQYGQLAKRLDCTGQLDAIDKETNSDGVSPVHIFGAMGR